ncbi:MAG: type II secretion system protein [Halarcobacter sp.]
MKNSFSLFELIIVLVILSILAAFALNKYLDSTNYANKVKIKTQIALIRNSIEKLNSENILKNISNPILLDSAKVDEVNTKLFKNILEFPLISTSSEKKELGKWIKTSSNSYKIYFNSDEYLEFKYKNSLFKCLNSKKLCEEFE